MNTRDEIALTDYDFEDEKLFRIDPAFPSLWYADIANYVSNDVVPIGLSHNQKKKFLHDVKFYFWDSIEF